MKKYKIVAVIVAVVCLLSVLSGCSPKHNDKATVDIAKTITAEFTREQVIELLGSPLAYYSEDDDWQKFGYDFLVYSPDDIQILEWYKGRAAKADNLPGFTSRLHWSNGTWERKYYTGVGKTETAQIGYIYISITFVDFKITKIDCLQFTQGQSNNSPIYTISFVPEA